MTALIVALGAPACAFDTGGISERAPAPGPEGAGSPGTQGNLIDYGVVAEEVHVVPGAEIAPWRDAWLGVEAAADGSGGVRLTYPVVWVDADPAAVALAVEIAPADGAAPMRGGVFFELALRRRGEPVYRTVQLGEGAAGPGPAPAMGRRRAAPAVSPIPYFRSFTLRDGALEGAYLVAEDGGALERGGVVRIALPAELQALELRLRPRPAALTAGVVQRYAWRLRKTF